MIGYPSCYSNSEVDTLWSSQSSVTGTFSFALLVAAEKGCLAYYVAMDGRIKAESDIRKCGF